MSGRWRASAVVALVLSSISLTGCTVGTSAPTPPDATHFGPGVLAAEQDHGEAGELRAVRAATVSALSAEIQAFVVDRRLRGQEPAKTLRTLVAAGPTRRRTILLARSHSPRLAKDLEQAFLFTARQDFGVQPSGSPAQSTLLDSDVWASGAFHVDRWEGVRITGDTARVLVRGEDRGTSWRGGAKRDGWRQEHLILSRDPTAAHGWRVVHHTAASTAA